LRLYSHVGGAHPSVTLSALCESTSKLASRSTTPTAASRCLEEETGLTSCARHDASSVVDGCEVNLGRASYSKGVDSSPPPAAGGQMCHAHRSCKAALGHVASSGPSCGELRDPVALVEGLGSLLLPLEEIPQSAPLSFPVMDGDVSGDTNASTMCTMGRRQQRRWQVPIICESRRFF
jgi:hypothetical protein